MNPNLPVFLNYNPSQDISYRNLPPYNTNIIGMNQYPNYNTPFISIPNLNMSNNNLDLQNRNKLEKDKINNLLQEMLSNHRNKHIEKNNDLDSKASNYILLYSIDPHFRNDICNILKNIYLKNDIQENQINLETIKFLLKNNYSEMDFLFKKYNN